MTGLAGLELMTRELVLARSLLMALAEQLHLIRVAKWTPLFVVGAATGRPLGEPNAYFVESRAARRNSGQLLSKTRRASSRAKLSASFLALSGLEKFLLALKLELRLKPAKESFQQNGRRRGHFASPPP